MNRNTFLKQQFLFVILVTMVIGFHATAGYSQEQEGGQIKTENRETKIVEALKLFGVDSYHSLTLVEGTVEDTAAAAKPQFDIMMEALLLADKVLYKGVTRDLAENFPKAARQTAAEKFIGGLQIRINYPQQLALKQIQSILGKEDSIDSGTVQTQTSIPGMPGSIPGSFSVKWHKYGWCWFGADEAGKVVALQADCKAIKPKE